MDNKALKFGFFPGNSLRLGAQMPESSDSNSAEQPTSTFKIGTEGKKPWASYNAKYPPLRPLTIEELQKLNTEQIAAYYQNNGYEGFFISNIGQRAIWTSLAVSFIYLSAYRLTRPIFQAIPANLFTNENLVQRRINTQRLALCLFSLPALAWSWVMYKGASKFSKSSKEDNQVQTQRMLSEDQKNPPTTVPTTPEQ